MSGETEAELAAECYRLAAQIREQDKLKKAEMLWSDEPDVIGKTEHKQK
jgi:hypothetical protein